MISHQKIYGFLLMPKAQLTIDFTNHLPIQAPQLQTSNNPSDTMVLPK